MTGILWFEFPLSLCLFPSTGGCDHPEEPLKYLGLYGLGLSTLLRLRENTTVIFEQSISQSKIENKQTSLLFWPKTGKHSWFRYILVVTLLLIVTLWASKGRKFARRQNTTMTWIIKRLKTNTQPHTVWLFWSSINVYLWVTVNLLHEFVSQHPFYIEPRHFLSLLVSLPLE